jgi:hypothetical protein
MKAFSMRLRAVLVFGLGVMGTLGITTVARAQSSVSPSDLPISQPILTDNQLLWKVAPDECFNGIGVNYPPMSTDDTCADGQPKANQAYIWGLTEQSGKLWFGTMANTACTLQGTLNVTPVLINNFYVCEFGLSQYARTYASLPPVLGDWRPPKIYSWDLATGTLTEEPESAPLLQTTLGFRGAGSIDNIAFLGGPSRLGTSVNIFAFRADTGQFLGACALTTYNYIRNWDEVDGVLYVGVGSTAHGAVLRWNGTPQSFVKGGDFCTDFIEVGQMTADAANITKYVDGSGQDRLAVTTVPIRSGVGNGAGVGVWISPPIPDGGLTEAQDDEWRQVWSPLSYDPDTIVARFGYAGGAEQYFDGWLYWGTIHLQNSAALYIHEGCTASFCFGKPQNPSQLAALAAGVYRTTSVWRGRNLENPKTREIQLLYGESELPACCSAPHTFAMTPTGWTPLYGSSGFGNPANEYTWTMAVFDGHLFVGTFDESILQPGSDLAEYGADLWRFDSSDSPAVNEDYSGLGNPLNYGIRILHPLDDGSGLIAGMANPFNLSPNGGWELRVLKEGTSSSSKH